MMGALYIINQSASVLVISCFYAQSVMSRPKLRMPPRCPHHPLLMTCPSFHNLAYLYQAPIFDVLLLFPPFPSRANTEAATHPLPVESTSAGGRSDSSYPPSQTHTTIFLIICNHRYTQDQNISSLQIIVCHR